ncbi:RidA family protein [Nitratireductor thuwali]|uniref:2-iminobutanoate/2-iminopropanoate deaminase n=1 Tax=Nitratireductor thuwali TaxID=2267699 RepID=A0ABY5MHJ2_9HYPH|nr:2-iminobutanoate/2-iminopropanoate deaminase [Nitratireductor thuwali]
MNRTDFAGAFMLASLPFVAFPVHAASVELRSINPAEVRIPGISQAIEIKGGNLLVLSGQVPLTADGGIAGETIEEQLVQIFENMRIVLAEAGTDFTSIARLTVYFRDYEPSMLQDLRNVRERYLSRDIPPASTVVGVSALYRSEVLVEVEAIAVVP